MQSSSLVLSFGMSSLQVMAVRWLRSCDRDRKVWSKTATHEFVWERNLKVQSLRRFCTFKKVSCLFTIPCM